jgi:hypothetical protein
MGLWYPGKGIRSLAAGHETNIDILSKFERSSLQELAGTPYIQDGVLVKRATK